MKIFAATLLMLLGTQQRLPTELLTAAAPQQQLPAIQLEQQPQAQGLDRPIGSIQFRDAPLVAVLNTLAQYAGLNLVIDPDITGAVTQDLNNVTVLQALEAILPQRKLRYRIENGMLRVERILMENRTFKFDYITTQRSLTRAISASSTAGGGGTSFGGGVPGALGAGAASLIGAGGGGGGSSASLSGSETTNLLADIETALKTLSSGSPDAKIIFNKMASVIYVTDFPLNLEQIGLFLETIQTAVHRQVVIEAKVVEVRLDNSNQFGVNWTALFGNALQVEQPFTGAGGFTITGTYKNARAVLDALATQGAVNVLSSPTIATLHNQPAIMRVGTQDIFFTTTTQVDPRTGGIVQSTVTPQAIHEGIVLDVTPQISDDDIIMMNVHPTITERTGQVTSPRGESVPLVDVRETDTVVRVRAGGTVLIGGLISDRQIENMTKVPVLGDLPFFGGLFRKSSKETRKTDLIILLTPRILDIQSAADYSRSRIENQERMKAEQPQ